MITSSSQSRLARLRLALSWVSAVLLVALFSPARAERDSAPVGPGPGSYQILSADSVIRIPFDIYQGDVRMAVAVNGRPAHLLLDDGFMWDALLFWGGPAVDSFGLTYDGEIAVGDTSPENVLQSRTASGVRVQFPGVEFLDQTAVVTPSASGNSMMWAGSEGQISAAFFKHFVVDINFDKMIITLIEPAKFEYHGHGSEVPLRPLGFGPSAIPASLDLADGRTVSVDLMLDLGYNDQLQITTTGEHHIPVPDRFLPANLGMNIQGVPTLGSVGRLARVAIGSHELAEVIVAFVSPEHTNQTYSEVMVGLGLLSRFNIVYDYPHRRLYLEPNQSFTVPFEYNSTGLALRRTAEGLLEIAEVYPDSPASEAGLQTGQVISCLNGRPVDQIPPDERRAMLRQTGGTLVFSVQQGEETRNVSITLRRVI